MGKEAVDIEIQLGYLLNIQLIFKVYEVAIEQVGQLNRV